VGTAPIRANGLDATSTGLSVSGFAAKVNGDQVAYRRSENEDECGWLHTGTLAAGESVSLASEIANFHSDHQVIRIASRITGNDGFHSSIEIQPLAAQDHVTELEDSPFHAQAPYRFPRVKNSTTPRFALPVESAR